jgi:DNA ligase-1
MFPELSTIESEIAAEGVILDSEAVGFDPQTGRMVPFQMTITRKRKHGVEAASGTVPLKFFVFDILYKDGEDLIERPLSQRRKILQETVKEQEGGSLLVDEWIVSKNPVKVREFHGKQLAEGLEGAMVKKAQGKYLPGRQDWNWVKFKEAEGTAAKLSDTLDLVVMGYYVGRGKRQKFGLGAFLVGVRDGDGIRTIAKIGTGLTDEEWGQIFEKLQKVRRDEMPKVYQVEKTLVPDVWVEPEVIVEIAADEVTKSPMHTSGYALRFPRLVKFRDDKSVNEITNMAELMEIARL